MNQVHNRPKRKAWEHPWRYRESFLVAFELLLLGLILEVLTGGRGAPLLQWPVNFVGALIILIVLVYLHLRFRKRPFVKWLSSVPAAISAIVFLASATLLLGFIPQNNPDANRYLHVLGLTHVKNSWLMLIAGFYFLVILGMVALRRSLPLKSKNLGFLMNHAGLWIVISAGYLGSGDLMRLQLPAIEGGDPVSHAGNPVNRQMVELPFAVELLDFIIKEYNPRIGIMDPRSGMLMGEDGQSLIMIEEGLKTSMLDWTVEIADFEPNARKTGNEYFRNDSMGAAPAAFVKAVNILSGEERSGWISCGSFMVPHQHMPLDPNHTLVMTFPEPERYSSDIIIHETDGDKRPVTLEVNKPCKCEGWKLYQLSYDRRMGKWSRISVFEAVRDPWLPVVYTGIFLLLAGAVYLFWIGRGIKEEIK